MAKFKHKKSEEELYLELKNQANFLRKSNAEYDKGDVSEAKRIANCAYILCHDGTGRTKSLLGQTKIKTKQNFLSTSYSPYYQKMRERGQYNYGLGLCDASFTIASGGNAIGKYEPRLAEDIFKLFHELPFKKWYDEEIYRVDNKRGMSRKNLIFAIRSTDGGAHVDGELKNEEYVNLKTEGSGLVIQSNNEKPVFFNHPHLASMRQIGWELEHFLDRCDLLS